MTQPPKDPAVQGDDKSLGKLLGEVVGVALVKELREHRWYTNWRTHDEKDQWTADDFQQVKWPDDMGLIGNVCVDLVTAIKPKVEAAIQAQVDEAVRGARKTAAQIYDDGLRDGKELMRWVATTVLTNRMKRHSYDSNAYKALKEAREVILKNDDNTIVCKSKIGDNYPTENEL